MIFNLKELKHLLIFINRGKTKYFYKLILLYGRWFIAVIKMLYVEICHCGSAVTSLTSIHEDVGSIPGLLSGLRI